MSLPCRDDPDRWTDAAGVDEEAQQLCWECPYRKECAETALGMAAANPSQPTGIWAGQYLPDFKSNDLTRMRALKQLRRIARSVA